jgi:small subunit ribosomal protein S8
MVRDPISDFIIQLKNGSTAGKESVTVSFSKLKFAIAQVLEREGFVGAIQKKGKKTKKYLEVVLKYEGKTPRITEVGRVSRLSQRLYYKVKDIHGVKQGHGALILTTPKGIMTDREARKANVGGEPLFKIW